MKKKGVFWRRIEVKPEQVDILMKLRNLRAFGEMTSARDLAQGIARQFCKARIYTHFAALSREAAVCDVYPHEMERAWARSLARAHARTHITDIYISQNPRAPSRTTFLSRWSRLRSEALRRAGPSPGQVDAHVQNIRARGENSCQSAYESAMAAETIAIKILGNEDTRRYDLLRGFPFVRVIQRACEREREREREPYHILYFQVYILHIKL